MKNIAPVTLAVLFPVLVACTGAKAPPAQPATAVQAKVRSFVPPTAEQAYRLQDDCSRRGEMILRNSFVGSALTQEQVSRYSATTNRCYVRLEVHAADLSEWGKYDNSTYLKDGQTGELLAFFMVKAGGARSFLGFGCSNSPCVEERVADCMNGKECEPE
jgi:hypothetical protein